MANPQHLATTAPGSKRNATEALTILLTEEPYWFSKDMLKRHTDIKVQRKKIWHYPHLDFISFENRALKLKNIYDEVSYELTIGIEPTSIKVSCNCGEEVETLCVHAYKALDRLILHTGTFFFQYYRPRGIVELALSHKRYFNFRESALGPDISPKTELNTTYSLTDKLQPGDLKRVLELPAPTSPFSAPMKDTALTYILVDSGRNKFCPFLLPCMGYLNKAKTDIKYYQHFISGTERKCDNYLTDDQKELNKICYDMCQLAEKMPGSLLNELPLDEEKISGLFRLWQIAFPLLQDQQFIYNYTLYWKRDLRGKPEKSKLGWIDISTQKPRLHFHLLDKGDVLQLHLRISVKGEMLADYFAEQLFFVQSSDCVYLLSSLKDAATVEWMDKLDNCITIFKEHYDSFEVEFLTPLREIYPVEIMSSAPLRIDNPKKKATRKNKF